MYTITLLNDRRLYGAHKEAIMQYDNMVGKIQFLIPQTYDGNDMRNSRYIPYSAHPSSSARRLPSSRPPLPNSRLIVIIFIVLHPPFRLSFDFHLE